MQVRTCPGWSVGSHVTCPSPLPPGVQSAAVSVICELARKNPRNYLSLAPTFFKLMTISTNNWMLIKIIKLVGGCGSGCDFLMSGCDYFPPLVWSPDSPGAEVREEACGAPYQSYPQHYGHVSALRVHMHCHHRPLQPFCIYAAVCVQAPPLCGGRGSELEVPGSPGYGEDTQGSA